ncbi:hypothetical protein ACRALDRAFT_2060783 [Sodiomyces alcalophilus JCM 7366]|uniref:uncharacterized protein n=1 Tax=Sodiomyces alcalophilus JCM 7366 TaxID=591952 RepID=UPI0039B57E78
MATTTGTPAQSQSTMTVQVAAEPHPPPPLNPTADHVTGEDGLYSDDAQSVMQPALSPAATRLTLPKTPAAEKAAAMDALPADSTSYFDSLPRRDEGQRPAASSTGFAFPSFPSSWRSSRPDEEEPTPVVKERQTEHVVSHSPNLPRPKRSGSIGTDALKRFSRALPSLPRPAHLFNSVSSHLFPSSPSTSPSSSPTDSETEKSATARSPGATRPDHGKTSPTVSGTRRPHRNTIAHPVVLPPLHPRKPSVAGSAVSASSRTRSLRRSTSDDSLLYHSMSRVSSLGDDNRFDHITEMTNSRIKAIRDSLPDRPSFRMPSLPRLSPQLKMFQPFEDARIPPIPEAPTAPASSSPASGSAALDGMTPLDRVLENLTGDLVILGGYRGSILRSAEPPHQQLWAPVKIGFNLRKADLEVGLDPEDEETMEKRIIPSGMLQNIGPIDISRKLFKKLRSCENARNGTLRVWDYGYDWRLSPHRLSRGLIEFLAGLPSNQTGSGCDSTGRPSKAGGALVIAHSLGGMITRHAVNQRPDLFSGVVFAGTPQRCINVLGPVRNGDAVLLNEKILTAQVNFSLRTTFAFLPEDGFCFIDKETKEEYPIDFFSVDDWIKHRLSPCLEPALPPSQPRPAGGFGSILRVRGGGASEKRSSQVFSTSRGGGLGRKADLARERNLNPQLDSSDRAGPFLEFSRSFSSGTPSASSSSSSPPLTPAQRARNIAYLERTLAEIKQFRAELAHEPSLSAANAYPPMAVIYSKDTPTVYAAKVAGRQAIKCADAYDDLVFRPGDGVVLAREAQLPEGYELVRGGKVSTERGHLTMLGDMPAVGQALEAVVRGRRKGIGLGKPKDIHRDGVRDTGI